MGRVAGGGGKYWEVRRGRGGGGREREGRGGGGGGGRDITQGVHMKKKRLNNIFSITDQEIIIINNKTKKKKNPLV